MLSTERWVKAHSVLWYSLTEFMDISHFNARERKRYNEKIGIIGCDPYEAPPDVFHQLSSADRLPDFSFHDIYIYLIHNPSSYTGESLKAYKSTDAYRYFTAGWVIDSKIWHLKGKKMHILKAKVNHSQALNTTPTQPWIAVKEDGTVLMAHCTCKAGLGEACSHAAALMYALLAAVNLKDGQSSTEKACAWVLPGKTSKIQYEELSKISMTQKKPSKSTPLPTIPVPSEDEYIKFFQQLHECDVQDRNPKGTAILSVIEGHSNRYKPKTLQLNLPQPLTSLFSNARLSANLSSLLVESEKVFDDFQLTDQESLTVEEVTREQSASKVWFEQRAGRVTASVFHEASRADSAISLIKRICYPRSCQFSTEAVRWGSQNEPVARSHYIKAMQDHHTNFQVITTGLIINTSLPWIGASPDGIVSCVCHGRGVLEIKCPFTLKDGSIANSCNTDANFCLKMKDNGMALKCDHKYMSQVQAQMRIANAHYCDFVVWSPKGMFMQRIQFNEAFFSETYGRVKQFIKSRLLPELLGKYYTVPRTVVNSPILDELV